MSNERFQQSFEGAEKAHQVFQRILAKYPHHKTEEVYQMALIQAFEILYERSWKTMERYLESKGFAIEKHTPKDIMRQAFAADLLSEGAGKIWLESADWRNKTSHTYDEATLHSVLEFISDTFAPIADDFYLALKKEL